jgi:nucleoside-diphosphate-sugar epimerase
VAEFSTQTAMAVVILRPALVYGVAVKGNIRSLAKAVQYGLPRPPSHGERSMIALNDLIELLLLLPSGGFTGISCWIVSENKSYSTQFIYDAMRFSLGKSKAKITVPLWCWRSTFAVLDLLSRRKLGVTTEKFFGTERYDGSALQQQLNWRPALELADVLQPMLAADMKSEF